MSGHLIRIAWTESLVALRANILPGLLLQAIMGAMAVAYLVHPPSRHLFEELSFLRSRWGLLFSFVGTASASVLLPELLRLLLPGKTVPGRSGQPLYTRLLFGFLFWGLIGMQVDLFYRLQYHLFGPSDHLYVILAKVLVDALLYCPLLAIPQVVCGFLWLEHGFTGKGFSGHTARRFYALKVFPVLLTNWMVWIPLICIIYSLPAPLGVPFFIVAQCFWVMVLTTLSSARIRKA